MYITLLQSAAAAEKATEVQLSTLYPWVCSLTLLIFSIFYVRQKNSTASAVRSCLSLHLGADTPGGFARLLYRADLRSVNKFTSKDVRVTVLRTSKDMHMQPIMSDCSALLQLDSLTGVKPFLQSRVNDLLLAD